MRRRSGKGRGGEILAKEELEETMKGGRGQSHCQNESGRGRQKGKPATPFGGKARKKKAGQGHRENHPQQKKGRLVQNVDAHDFRGGEGEEDSRPQCQKHPSRSSSQSGGKGGGGAPIGLHHASRRKKGMGLVKRVCDDMHDGHADHPEAALEQHESDLGAGGPGQGSLDVAGDHHGQGRDDDRGQGIEDEHVPEDRFARQKGPASQKEDRAGVDESGMHEGRDRSRGLHHLDQPAMEGKLGALQDRRQDDETACDQKGLRECPIQGANRRSNPGKVRRVQGADDENDRPQKARVGNPVEQVFLAGRHQGIRPVLVEGQQLVEEEAGGDPGEKEGPHVSDDNQRKEGSQGQGQPPVKAPFPAVPVHVARRKTRHDHSHEGHQQQHHEGEGVDRDIDLERSQLVRERNGVIGGRPGQTNPVGNGCANGAGQGEPGGSRDGPPHETGATIGSEPQEKAGRQKRPRGDEHKCRGKACHSLCHDDLP